MFKHKDYIFEIYKTGSFTKTAEKLFVSQPSLSATVKRLEEKIGAPIFDRSSVPVGLTDVGKEYIEYAKKIKELEDSFERYVVDKENLITGKLSVGGSSLFSSYVLPEMVSDFKQKYSGIEFEIFEDSTKNLINKLKEGTLDVIIDNAVIEDETIASKAYLQERLYLAVPKSLKVNDALQDYRLTAEQIKEEKELNVRGVDLTKFKDLPFILLRSENDTGKRAKKLITKYGLGDNIVFYLDQQVTSYNLACTGVGIAFVGDALIKRVKTSSEIYYYPITDRYAVREVYFYYKKNKYLSLACKKFIEHNVK